MATGDAKNPKGTARGTLENAATGTGKRPKIRPSATSPAGARPIDDAETVPDQRPPRRDKPEPTPAANAKAGWITKPTTTASQQKTTVKTDVTTKLPAREPKTGEIVVPPQGEEPEEAKKFKTLLPPSKDMSRKELTEQYTPYVRSIAGKVKKTLAREIEFDDLVSYGMLGLFEAADRFDAKFGANFMTFAYYRIRGSIYDGLRGMGWVSRTEYQRYRMEAQSNAYLSAHHEQQVAATQENPKKTTDEEVTELGDVVEHLVTIYVTALDAMEGFQIKDDRQPSAEESMELAQARKLVAEAVEKLPDQEQKLLKLYYYKDLSLEDVGKDLGLSKSWTSRLHTRAIKKLSRLLRDLLEEYSDEMSAPAMAALLEKNTQPTGPPSR